MCLSHFKLCIKWLCRGSSPQRCAKTVSVINEKIKKFPSLLGPESLDDTAFGAVSSKLADHDGMPDRIRTCDLRSRSYAAVHESSAFWQVFMYDAQNMAVYKTALNRCGAIVHSCFLCHPSVSTLYNSIKSTSSNSSRLHENESHAGSLFIRI